MNCKEIQDYCLAYAGEKLRPDVEAHLATCEACRKAHAQALLVCKLMSLKKYEQPDPGFEARSLARIRNSIYEIEEQRQRRWRFWEIFEAGPVPALRYALAAAVLVLTGLNFVSMQNLPSLQPVVMDEPAPVFESRATLAVDTNPPVEVQVAPFAPFLLASSNRQPGQVQYGPGPSVPVSFGF
ncbi:MAG: hypothetical protein V1929_07720 [bacterium]